MTFRSPLRPAFWPALAILAAAGSLAPALAETVVSSPATPSGSTALVPGTASRASAPIVVAAVIDADGNAETARRALSATNEALSSLSGYDPMPASRYAPLSAALSRSATSVDWAWPFTASDYQKIGKAGGVGHALTMQVRRVAGGYEANAEVYDTARGALIGYGTGRASGEAEASMPSAIATAIADLNRTAVIDGVIVSKPGSGLARLSFGTLSGARGGARVEYLGANGRPVAFGTIVDIGAGDSLATVAPEAAFPQLFVNSRVRLVTNPESSRALRPVADSFDEEFRAFEKSFGLAAGIVGAVWFLAAR